MITITQLSEPRDDIRLLCTAFTAGLQAVLGSKLYAVIIYGAAAFPEVFPTGDVDFHVILQSELDDAEKIAILELFTRLARDFPPLGAELDGYFILLADAVQTPPPKHQLDTTMVDQSWALHREHIRAGRCIVLYGPDPMQIYPPAAWPELEQALFGELRFVEKNLAAYPDYCILNLCRLMYSFETRDVVISKARAANWARQALPEWRGLIELAIKSYARQVSAREQTQMRETVGELYRFACERIMNQPTAPGS